MLPTLKNHLKRCTAELVGGSLLRATEIDEPGNTDFRPDLVRGSQYGSAGAHLKSDAIEGIVAEHRRERAVIPWSSIKLLPRPLASTRPPVLKASPASRLLVNAYLSNSECLLPIC
jgi:hypothetical protein